MRIAGRELCERCKQAAVRDICRRSGPRDREAEEALVLALMGVVPFFAPLVWPFAMVRSIAVQAQYRRDPDRPGAWKSRLAVGVCLVTLAAWILGGAAWVLLH